jgi:hypothetical protein
VISLHCERSRVVAGGRRSYRAPEHLAHPICVDPGLMELDPKPTQSRNRATGKAHPARDSAEHARSPRLSVSHERAQSQTEPVALAVSAIEKRQWSGARLGGRERPVHRRSPVAILASARVPRPETVATSPIQVLGVDCADPDLAGRAVGVDPRVGELDPVADQGGEPGAGEGGHAPAAEVADCIGVAVASRSDGAQRGGGMVACLVLPPGGAAPGAIRRPRPLEHRALKPEHDELVVHGATRRLRLDQPEPLARGEGLPQELVARDPRQRPDVVAGELEQIEGNEVELPHRGGVGLMRGSAYRSEVLDGTAVAGAERDELSIEDRPTRCRGNRLKQRAESIAQACTSARPSANPTVVIDRDKQPEPVPLGLDHPIAPAGHVAARVLSIGSAIAIP